MKKSTLLLILTAGLFLVASSTSAQETANEGLKAQIINHYNQTSPSRPLIVWQDSQNLTWDDFTPNPMNGQETGLQSIVSIYLQNEPHSQKTGSTEYSWIEYKVAFNPNNSFYNPESASEWELRYNNVMFDIAELSARIALGEPQQINTQVDKDPFNKLLEASMEAFAMESGFGKDTAVILAYEKEVREELERNPRKEFSPEKVAIDYSHGFTEQIGYLNNTILGECSDIFQPFNGFSVGLGGLYKKLIYDFDIDILWSRALISGLYHDNKMDYDWVEGRKTSRLCPSLNIGYRIFSNKSFAFYPFAGIGTSMYSQKWKDENGKQKDSSFDASLCCNIGLDTDWTISRFVSHNSVSSNILRLKLYGTYEKNKVIGEFWSMNIGLSFMIAFKLKTNS